MAFIELGDVNIDMTAGLHIDGLDIPSFTWAWIGVKIGEGILANAGGLIFSKLLSSVFGGPTLEEMLNRQLERISQEVERRLVENDLRNYRGLLSTVSSLMTEYQNNPANKDRLNYSIIKSRELVDLCQTISFTGYPSFIAAATIRLAVLQEAIKNDPAESRNFKEARDSYRDYHDQLRRQLTSDWDQEVAAAQQAMINEYASYEAGFDPGEPPIHIHHLSRENFNYDDRTFFGRTYDPKPNFDWQGLFVPIDKYFLEGAVCVSKWYEWNPVA